MRILILSYQDIYGGGAFRAAYQLFRLLSKNNYQVGMLDLSNFSDDKILSFINELFK